MNQIRAALGSPPDSARSGNALATSARPPRPGSPRRRPDRLGLGPAEEHEHRGIERDHGASPRSSSLPRHQGSRRSQRSGATSQGSKILASLPVLPNITPGRPIRVRTLRPGEGQDGRQKLKSHAPMIEPAPVPVRLTRDHGQDRGYRPSAVRAGGAHGKQPARNRRTCRYADSEHGRDVIVARRETTARGNRSEAPHPLAPRPTVN